MTAMKMSSWIGALGVLLFVASLFRTPYSGPLAIISGGLGVIAAILGSKWWLAIPGTLIGITAIMMLLLRHAD
jgi:hypothetical protein